MGQEVAAQHQKAARPGLPASRMIGSTACTGWLRADHFRCAHSAAGSPSADRQTTPKGQGAPRRPKPAPNPTCHNHPEARTDQGPLPTSPTDGYRVLGYAAHFRAVAATCLSGAQANLRPSPTPPTDHHRAPGPRHSPSGLGNNVPLWPPDRPRACAKLTNKRFSGTWSSHLSALSIFDGPWLAAAAPRRHFRQPVKPGHISGLRQFGPQTDFGCTAPIGPPSTGPNAPLPPMLPLPPLPANLTLPCQKDAPLPS